jgi:hypothetical protein
MPKQILAVAPVNLRIAGRVYSIEAGKTLPVSDDEASMIFASPSSSKFKLVGDFMSETPISIHNAGLPAYTPPKTVAPDLAAHKDWATPFVPGTVLDPILSPVAQPVQAGEDFFDAVMDTASVSLPLPAQQDTDYPEASIDVAPERTSITPDTHWSKVKVHLSLLEKEEPINYTAVQEIKLMFPKSVSIQAQCDRILATQG